MMPCLVVIFIHSFTSKAWRFRWGASLPNLQLFSWTFNWIQVRELTGAVQWFLTPIQSFLNCAWEHCLLVARGFNLIFGMVFVGRCAKPFFLQNMEFMACWFLNLSLISPYYFTGLSNSCADIFLFFSLPAAPFDVIFWKKKQPF